MRNSNKRRTLKSILLVKTFLGLVEMTSGLVNVSFSFPDWQAVKMIFFAPCSYMNFQSKFSLRWKQYSPWVAIIRTLTQNVNCNMLSAFLLENGFYFNTAQQQNRIMTMLYCRSKWNPNKILSTKLVETLWPKEPFWNFADLKWKNEVFPSPSPIKQWHAVAWQDKTRWQDDLLNSAQFYMT